MTRKSSELGKNAPFPIDQVDSDQLYSKQLSIFKTKLKKLDKQLALKTQYLKEDDYKLYEPLLKGL